MNTRPSTLPFHELPKKISYISSDEFPYCLYVKNKERVDVSGRRAS